MIATLIIKVLPLYLLILIGYVAGRINDIGVKPMADFTIHYIAPFVLFSMAWQTDIQPGPAFRFIAFTTLLTLLMAGAAYLFGRAFWGDKRTNLFSHQVLGSNSGYFGIPVVFALFATDTANVWILIMMVSTVLHTSLGYYILATGNLSAWDGLKKLLKLPLFHSMLWGLVFSFAGIAYPDGLLPTLDIFKGAYFVLGMAIIGLSISRLKLQHFDGGYILQTLIWRFPVWTLAALGLIWTDAMTLGWLSPEMQALIVLYSAMPLPANSVAYAVQLNVHPERAASAVLASTMAALVYIPLIMTFYPALLP